MADSQPRLIPQGRELDAYASSDRSWIINEVSNGLRRHRGRIADAIENQAFFDLDSDRYQPRREAETEFDFAGRPKRQSGFVQQAVDRLCEHTYNPGPQRTIGDGVSPMADSLLHQVWEDNHIDCLMHEAEQLSTLNDVAAIEVKCTNDPDRPVDLQIWGADEFTIFVDPDDPRKATAAVTIDRYNARTRYKLWFDDVVYTFLTDQYNTDKTAGARVAKQQSRPERNTYGCIPFAYMHYGAPVRRFWTPGPGTFLRKTELRVNDRLSELDELIGKYGRPIGIFKNVSPLFTPEVGPGRFMRLCRGGTGYSGEGYSAEGEPSAEYLQPQLAIEAIWTDLEKYIRQICTAVGLPWTALELEYTDAPSGISLVIKSAPLLTRARQRRPIYQMAECQLARVTLEAVGNHYGDSSLIEEAKKLKLILAWAEPHIPIPGPERDQSDEWEMQLGIKSRVAVCMERYGLTRNQAIEHMKQVSEDEEEAEEVMPEKEEPIAANEEPETDEGRPEEEPEVEMEEEPEGEEE